MPNAPVTSHISSSSGGWRDYLSGQWTLKRPDPDDPSTFTLKYPGDPVYRAVAWGKLRDETIVLFPSDWVVVIQPDGSFETSRMD